MKSASRPRALVLCNPAARGARAACLWRRLEPHVCEFVVPTLVELSSPRRLQHDLAKALREGIRVFIAAGGDGTVHVLANGLFSIADRPPLAELAIGALGLGSSNDYHKARSRRHLGTFVRLDARHRQQRDVCLAHFRVRGEALRSRCFLVSASLGLTAEGNARFNSGDSTIEWLKPWSVDLAIARAALWTWASFRPIPARLVVGGERLSYVVASVNVQKTPYVSGMFRLDTPAAPDDGLLGVNVCTLRSRAALARRLMGLLRGRFAGKPGCRFWHVPRFEVETERPVALELDGEIYEADAVTFEIARESIGECT